MKRTGSIHFQWVSISGSVISRIVGFSLLVVLMGLFMRAGLMGQYLRDDLMKVNGAQLEAIGEYVAKDIGNELQERRRFLEQLANTFPVQHVADMEYVQNWVNERTQLFPLFLQGVDVLDLQGHRAASIPVHGVGALCATDDYFQHARAGVFYVGCPVLMQKKKYAVITMGMPVRNKQGEVVAVLAGRSALRSSNFLNALQTMHIGTSGQIVLVSPRDGMIVEASHQKISLKPVPEAGKHEQYEQALQGFRGVRLGMNANGEEEIAALASVPGSDWFVMATLPTQEAFALVWRMYQFMAISGVLLLIALLALWVLGLRWLLAPLHRAARLADQMSREDKPVTLLPVERSDEVGRFTEAFNRVLSKLMISQGQMQYLAFHDGLTRLANRRHFNQHLDQEWRRACREERPISLILLDVDNFKSFNDFYGHPMGDDCLLKVATVLASHTLRAGELAARYGGDEFAVILPCEGGAAEQLAERIREKVQEYNIVHRSNWHGVVTVSLGVASMVPQRGEPCSVLLERADQALYKAKQKGRNQVGAWEVQSFEKAPEVQAQRQSALTL